MRALALLLLLALLAACSSTPSSSGPGSAGPPAPSGSPSAPVSPSKMRPTPTASMSVITLPERPPTGRVLADLRQSSRDAALGRMQVWLVNDRVHDLDPRRIVYVDPRLRRGIVAERLRLDPAGSQRGYPLTLPEPDCRRQPRARPTLWVTTPQRTLRLKVRDEADVVERYVASRCAERAVARLVDLRWADSVPATGGVGTLTLVAKPTGRPGRVRIDAVNGTPVFVPSGSGVWRPRVTVRGTGPTARIPLPLIPARCDQHAFIESGGATAFRVHLRVQGDPVEVVVRMSPAGAQAAIGFAVEACGFG